MPHSPLLFPHLIGRAEVQKESLANEKEVGRRSTAWMNVARVFGIPDANQGAEGCLHHPNLTATSCCFSLKPFHNFSPAGQSWSLCCHHQTVTTLRLPAFEIWGKIRET